MPAANRRLNKALRDSDDEIVEVTADYIVILKAGEQVAPVLSSRGLVGGIRPAVHMVLMR